MPPRPKPSIPTPARVTRSRAAATTSAVAPPVAKAPSPSTAATTAGDAAPPKKRRKVTVKKESTLSGPAPTPARRTPPPPFSLPAAIAHLSSVDARFAPLFERIPCKPFVEIEEAASKIKAEGVHEATNYGGSSSSSATPSGAAASPIQIDPFRTLVTSIIGQQVSWMAARSITRRFVEHFCGATETERYGDGPFPTREQVAAAEVAALKGVGCSTRKAEYLIDLARHFIAGRLTDDLLLNGSDEEVADALIAVRGIGRWTVDMFLIFTLRRPDVLPVGDLGVQKGLLRWVLAAHGALPAATPKTPKTPKKGSANGTMAPPTPTPSKSPLTLTTSMASVATEVSLAPTEVDEPQSQATDATYVSDAAEPATPGPPVTPRKSGPSAGTFAVPATPDPYVLVTPSQFSTPSAQLPSTPAPPPVTPSASTNPVLPLPVSDSILLPPQGWDTDAAHRAAPLPDGLNVTTLRARLAGKKAKGNVYLLPEEMEALTHAWRPYRSLGTYYTWSMAGEKS